MKKWFLTSVLLVTACSCATTGGGRFKNIFSDDLAQSRESIRSGSVAQSVSDLSMVLEMDPKNTEARYLRALAFQKAENHERAVADYERVLKNDPSHAKAHYNLGMIFAYRLNRADKALYHFDRYITLDPGALNVRSTARTMIKLDAQAGTGDPSDINRIIEEVLAERGVIAADPAENGARRRYLRDAIRATPGSAKLHYAVGRAHEQDGRERDAVISYKKALNLKPTFAECHEALGKLFARTGKKEDGDIHLFKAKLFGPDNTSPL